MSETNGRPHTRVLDAPSLEACQATLRGWLASAPDPTQWGAWQQQFAWLTATVARLTREAGEDESGAPVPAAPGPPPVSSSAARAVLLGFTGEACSKCGSFEMVRAGSCSRCGSCGDTSGGCG